MYAYFRVHTRCCFSHQVQAILAKSVFTMQRIHYNKKYSLHMTFIVIVRITAALLNQNYWRKNCSPCLQKLLQRLLRQKQNRKYI